MTKGSEPTVAPDGLVGRVGAAWRAALAAAGPLRREAADRLARPDQRRVAALAGAGVLAALGLLLPPVALPTRVTSIGYTTVRADGVREVRSRPPGAVLEFSARDLPRAARVRVKAHDGVPGRLPPLPQGHDILGSVYELGLRGSVPGHASLLVPLAISAAETPYVDPYGWDGERWRWLPVTFPGPGLARVELPLAETVPSHVVLTRASAGSTAVSAVVLPPPSTVPAAVAELPILEMAAYHLAEPDGSLDGEVFPIPARPSGRYATVDNLEDGARVRSDLVNNMLTMPASRRRNRQEIVDAARRADLTGVVLDYRGVAGDLEPVFVDFVARLAADLHESGAELVVAVPMPRPAGGGWDASPHDWTRLAHAADGLRVLLPSDAPLEIDALDSMVRWALTQVERQELQLGVPVQGRDLTAGGMAPIGFGAALGKILNMARSDAPRRISPGEEAEVELPTLREAGLGRDPGVGMWRFEYWDDYRSQHTVWLNDALGLKPAFDIAARYRLGRIALLGVEAGLDPALWHIVRGFERTGTTGASLPDYQLAWELKDPSGAVLRSSQQPLDDPTFRFRAPAEEGTYRLGVSLVTATGELVAPGETVEVRVAPAPAPTPRPTEQGIVIEPTRSNPATRPPPLDELTNRAPVRADVTPEAAAPRAEDDARLKRATVLRSGPTVESPALGDARVGDRFDVIGRSADELWFLVSMKSTGLKGWVRDRFLDLTVDPAALPIMSLSTPEP